MVWERRPDEAAARQARHAEAVAEARVFCEGASAWQPRRGSGAAGAARGGGGGGAEPYEGALASKRNHNEAAARQARHAEAVAEARALTREGDASAPEVLALRGAALYGSGNMGLATRCYEQARPPRPGPLGAAGSLRCLAAARALPCAAGGRMRNALGQRCSDARLRPVGSQTRLAQRSNCS